MTQRQVELKNLETGMSFSLGDNVSLHLYLCMEKEKIYIKFRREDARKGRVFVLDIDQWGELEGIRGLVNNWLASVKQQP